MPSAVSPVFSYRLPRRINQAAPLLDGKNKHRQLSAGGQAAIQPKQRNKATHTHTHTGTRYLGGQQGLQGCIISKSAL